MNCNKEGENDQQQQQLRIVELEAEVKRLQNENDQLRACASTSSTTNDDDNDVTVVTSVDELNKIIESINTQKTRLQQEQKQQQCLLTNQDIERYSRQMLVEYGGIQGIVGQEKLQSTSILVIGAGGIGSTVLLYLTASGIGHMGIMDYDVVEMSNLHRQVIHSTHRVGRNKAVSACQTMQQLNPTIHCYAITMALSSENAMDIIKNYDIIMDATDNPLTRYIINDACVLSGKPLISGSAVGVEGQLTIYNYKNGPCYRCLYPPNPSTYQSASCSDSGVLGQVPGLIGILQSMEAIKMITNTDDDDNNSNYIDKSTKTKSTKTATTMHDRMLLYDASSCSFVTIKKPKKNPNCILCSNNVGVQRIHSMNDSSRTLQGLRGPSSCQMQPPPRFSKYDDNSNDIPVDGVSCFEYKQNVMDKHIPHILLDVRVERQYEICSIPHSTNIPLYQLQTNVKECMEQIRRLVVELKNSNSSISTNTTATTNNNGSSATPTSAGNNESIPIYCICRRGIASVEATEILKMNQTIVSSNDDDCCSIYNIRGGLVEWQQQVDPNFPKY